MPGCTSSTAQASTLVKASACSCAAASWTPNTTSRCRRTSMAASEQYRRQAALLVRTIPLVATETCFALKGGTAINLFVRDMPRLSVDIDLTYLPWENRMTSLANIDAAMQRLDKRIREGLRGARGTSVRMQLENIVTK